MSELRIQITMPTIEMPIPSPAKIAARSSDAKSPALNALHHETNATTKPKIVSPMPHLPASRSGFAAPPVTLSFDDLVAELIEPRGRHRVRRRGTARLGTGALGGVHLVHLTIS